jgi:ABC-type uncharacterized transport system fused permease/ATPase subunit
MFFDALSLKNEHLIYIGLMAYFFNLFFVNIVQTFKPYFEIRTGLIKRLLKTARAFHIKKDLDNIPQRIQEDIKLSIQYRIQVYAEYAISGSIVVWLIVQNYTQPILLGGSLLYSLLCIGIAYMFNPSMVRAEREIQINEANFRVAASNGIFRSFGGVITSNIFAAKTRLAYGIANQTQVAIMTVLPYLVLIPAYVGGSMTLGNLMYFATTFELLVLNMAIVINLFPVLTQAKASHNRVKELFRRGDEG